MEKILLIPLDERPCNYNFPEMLADDTDFKIVMPPKEILGNKKIAGDTDKIWDWLVENIKDCDNAVISIDTLLYSGIVPSRLHHFTTEYLLKKLEKLRELKKINPKLTVYAFNLIMRNPTYSSAEEEPDYYDDWGREIHLFGVINHKKELGIATNDELAQLDDINNRLPKEVIEDYLTRRDKNIEVVKKVIKLAAEDVFDFVIIPQDDSSPYGLTAKDQVTVRNLIDDFGVNMKVYMYPDADAVANALLSRTINRLKGRRPLVYVKFDCSVGDGMIPSYEDRIVGETVKYQVLAAGGLVVTSAAEADIILIINIPSGRMQDQLQEPKNGKVLQRTPEYDANRNLVDAVEYADYAISVLHKSVIFGDIAYGNGGDPLLFSMLKQKGLLWKLAGYAGWNTSSNTLGTCIPMGMIFDIYGDTAAHRDFLALRYIEDVGYDAFVRTEVFMEKPSEDGLNGFKVDGAHGKVTEKIKNMLQTFATENLDDDSHEVRVNDCYLPWIRLFEAGLDVKVNKK